MCEVRLTERRACLVPIPPDENIETWSFRPNACMPLPRKEPCDALTEAAEAELLATASRLLSNETIELSSKPLDKVRASRPTTSSRVPYRTWTMEKSATDGTSKTWQKQRTSIPRTLLRAFHRVIGMGPVRYLRLRQLNMIRQHLYCAMGERLTITHIMQAAGRIRYGPAFWVVQKALRRIALRDPARSARAASKGQNCAQSPGDGAAVS